MPCIRYGQIDPAADHQRDRTGTCVICGEDAEGKGPGIPQETTPKPITEIPVDVDKLPETTKPIVAGEGCKRGESRVGPDGKPFQHIIDPVLKYCVFCGLGAPPPKQLQPDKPLESEMVGCPEHGYHKIAIVNGEAQIPDCLKKGKEASA